MKEQISDELFQYCLDLEKQWRDSLPRLTDKELLDIFPEAKRIIPDKISEWQLRHKQVVQLIRQKLTHIKHNVAEGDQWFWEEWVKVSDGEELGKVDKHIQRLKRLDMLASGKVIKGKIGQKEIQMALAVPIESLITPLRKSGKRLIALCPLHKEKTPSFFVYPDNSFYCYGCQVGGDVITLVKSLYGLDFIKSVKWLIGSK